MNPLLSMIGMIILWGFNILNLKSITIIYLISQICVIILAIKVLKSHLMLKPNRLFQGLNVKPLYTYGLKVYGMDFMGTLYNQADKIIIVSLLSPRDFGLYSVVYALSRIYNTVQLAIADIIFPKVTGLEPSKIISTVGRAFAISLLIMMIIHSGHAY